LCAILPRPDGMTRVPAAAAGNTRNAAVHKTIFANVPELSRGRLIPAVS